MRRRRWRGRRLGLSLYIVYPRRAIPRRAIPSSSWISKPSPLRDLEAFAREHVATGTDAVTPISLHRVRAWLRNPLAEPDDIVLIAALEEGRWPLPP